MHPTFRSERMERPQKRSQEILRSAQDDKTRGG